MTKKTYEELKEYFENYDKFSSIRDIQEVVNKARTTIQKSLKILLEEDFVTRLSEGQKVGYCFKYKKNV